MGSIHVHEFVTGDGVIDAPAWGRKTYGELEEPWSTRTDGDPGTDFFNDTPKYVVSSTLADPTWRNSEVIGPYDPERLRRLKDEVGDIYVAGSGTLVRAMLADRLVDELHLLVYPLTRGKGPRLFAEGAGPLTMTLAGSAAFEHGVVYLNYRPA